MKFSPLLLLLLANAAGATGLDDMKSALAGLQGQGVLRGTYEVHQTSTDLESKKGPESTAAAAQVSDDGSALDIRWDRGLLKRAADDAARAKPDNKLQMLIGQTSATRLASTVNYAPKLLDMLAHAQLRSEKTDTYQGKPARLLELSMKPPVEENGKVSIKENSHIAQVWIGADGLPLAATVAHKVRASFMVFISYEESSKEDMVFSVANNRLVLVKREEQGMRKGAGSDATYRNLYTFTPRT